jgi:hypothetical protein
MRHPLAGTLRIFQAALATGAAGLALLGAAVVVAGTRFDACGASRLDATEAACRFGAQLLLGAYAMLAVALVLGAVSLSLLWRVRRRHRRG